MGREGRVFAGECSTKDRLQEIEHVDRVSALQPGNPGRRFFSIFAESNRVTCGRIVHTPVRGNMIGFQNKCFEHQERA